MPRAITIKTNSIKKPKIYNSSLKKIMAYDPDPAAVARSAIIFL